MTITEVVAKAVTGRPVDNQIKTRNRVRDLAEVYTDEREVNAMLDLVQDTLPSAEQPENHDRTFLEPACGHGNFLMEILRRKLSTVTPSRYKRAADFEHRVLRCVASIYGIDVDKENVAESRKRLREVVCIHLENAGRQPTEGFVSALGMILETNIIQADTLTDGATIEIVHYRPGRSGTFLREWSPLESPEPQFAKPSQLELFGGLDSQLDLFRLEPRSDTRPVHYSELAQYPGPTRG